MSNGKEGKIPSLRKELIKAVELWDLWDISPLQDNKKAASPQTKPPEYNKIFAAIKEQLEKLSS